MSLRYSLALSALLFGTAFAPADTVKLTHRPPFRNVAVVGCRAGNLIFRGVSGELLVKPLAQIEWLIIDAAPEFSAGEQARAAGDWPRAATSYQGVRSGPTWLQQLAAGRLVEAADRTGDFPRAVSLYVELMGRGGAADPPRPRRPGPPGSPANAAARAALEAALATQSAGPTAQALSTLLLELYLYDEVTPLPAGLLGANLVGAPESANQPASAPRPTVGLLAPEAPASQPTPTTPTSAPTPSPRPRLPADSLLCDAIDAALTAGDTDRAQRLLTRAWPHVAPDARDVWRLLRARCWTATGRPADAAADLMDLAQHAPDPAHAAWALYYVGEAHERLDRPDVSRDLYEELAARPDVPAVSAAARAALTRLADPKPAQTP